MKLFLMGLIIGIGKVIPGVSGSMIAINFKVYDKIIKSLCNLSKKENIKFIINIGIGIMLAIILGSKILVILLNKYYFIMMLFFIGMLFKGTIDFSKEIKFKKKDIFLMEILLIVSLGLLFSNITYNYELTNTYRDNIMLFIGGVIEIISSIIPGISGTVLNMLMGIYDIILMLIGNIYNINYVINNINLYISYGIGMFFSLIVMILFINKIINKSMFNKIILCFSLSSLIYLVIKTFKYSFNFLELIIGIILFIIGYILEDKLNRN